MITSSRHRVASPRIRRSVAAAALTAAVTISAIPVASEASAQDSPVHGTVVNKIKNSVNITRSWCKQTKGPCSNKDIMSLKPGSTSPKGVDIDGFQVPAGKKYYVEYDKLIGSDKKCVSAGWHKIDDTIVARIVKASC